MTSENIVTNSIVILGTYSNNRDNNTSRCHHCSNSMLHTFLIIIIFFNTSDKINVIQIQNSKCKYIQTIHIYCSITIVSILVVLIDGIKATHMVMCNSDTNINYLLNIILLFFTPHKFLIIIVPCRHKILTENFKGA